MDKKEFTLENAQTYEQMHLAEADKYRPRFHVTGGIGWINDPNGFSVYNGEYHLFHQYHPYSTEWGPMHWGHLKTKDFIRWERLPIALAPDSAFDGAGCYSGNAIETADHKQLLIYTGVVKEFDENGTMLRELQQQCVAVGDGIHYEKYAGNPVIPAESLPQGSVASDFRDPKVFYDGDRLYCLVANKAEDGLGRILLYESTDGFRWNYVKIFAKNDGRYGTMWECPDFFSLDDTDILVISPMEMQAEGLEFHAGHGVIAFCGAYDRENKKFREDHVQALDYGMDFYAPQTLTAPDGRRIMIGWMRNWETTFLKHGDAPIYGAMTLPRELSLRNGRIHVNPVRELERYHANPVHLEKAHVKDLASFDGIAGRFLDMTVTVAEADYSFFKLRLCRAENREAVITYRPSENSITVDRTLASMPFDTLNMRSFPVDYHNGFLRLRVVMDLDSIELFVNDGERVCSFIVYDDLKADGIAFEASSEVSMQIDKYDILMD